MRTSIRIAALLLSGVVFMGCDDKSNTATTPPSTTPPAVDTTKMTDAAKNMADTAKTDAKNAADAAGKEMDKAKDAVKTEADKMIPATMPSMPAMPK